MIDAPNPTPSRRERKALAKANGTPFVPLAPPSVDAPQLSEMAKMEEALLDMIDTLNATTPDNKPAWFLLGPYCFHADGQVYFHNSASDMEKWTPLTGALEDAARAYLRERMNPGKKRAMPS